LDDIVAGDRLEGTRHAEFEPGGPVFGRPTGKPTQANLKMMKNYLFSAEGLKPRISSPVET